MRQLKSLGSIIKKLQYILSRKQKMTCVVLVIMLIIGSFLEMLGVSAILPFIEAILSPAAVVEKWYVQPFIELFQLEDINTIIILIGIAIIFIYFAKNLYLYLSTMAQTVVRSKIQKNLSTKMLQAYMDRSYEYFTSINTAEIIRGTGEDVTGVYNLMDNLFRFLGEMFTMLLISVFIVYTDAFMALCIIAIAGVCFLFIILGLKRKTRLYGEQKQYTETIRTKCAYQAIMGFKEIKVTRTTKHFIDQYDAAYEKRRRAEVQNEKIANLPERLIEAVCVAALIGVICIKIKIGADMESFVPKLAVFAVAAFRLLPSVSRMTRYMNGVIFNNTYLKSVYHNMLEIDEYRKQRGMTVVSQSEEGKAKFQDTVAIKEIEWKYQGTEKNVLQNISMEIKRGEAIGLIGKSGSGKTTLADILLGLLIPEKGTITMDGKNIFEHPAMWSKVVSYVPQNVFLLDDTIRNNVAFGCPAEDIRDQEIWECLRQAQMEEFVRRLPEGLETQVGERGIKFSGGQRQRIAIARALYNNPDIIVLDEATSALDNDTEKAVMDAIEALQGQKTLIIVAHRLTTIKNCDKIFEIENGRAIQRKREDIIKEIEGK